MFGKCVILSSFSVFVYLVVVSSKRFLYYSLASGWDNATVPVDRSKIFEMYLKKFNKSYGAEEYQTRLSIFRESMKEISRLNGETGARHGWTKFTDMSDEELSKFLMKPRDDPGCANTYETCMPHVNETIIPLNLSDKIDWRTKNAVGPVLDQLMCGCCWAMSIVGTMESMAVIRGYEYQQLSVQELLECSKYNKGCEGGDMTALYYLCRKKLALTTEDQYPLMLTDGECRSDKYTGVRRLKSYRVTCNMNEDYMLRVIEHHGPVIVVVNAKPLFNYIGGIIQKSCFRSHDGLSQNHMVQIVGFDLTGTVPYYIIKNTWGTLYGEEGYVKLATNRNMCGLAEEVAYLDVY